MTSRIKQALNIVNFELDPFILEHLEDSVQGMNEEVRRELIAPFLEDAGMEDQELFFDVLNDLYDDFEEEEDISIAKLESELSATSVSDKTNASIAKPAEKSHTSSSVRNTTGRKARRNQAVVESNEAEIKATTIQSRFHVDTLETLSNDIDLKSLNISIGEKQILVDAELRLFAGVKYGLTGRNGVGKSTLFKAIGYGLITGFPTNVRVMYVEQLDGIDPQKVSLKVIRKSQT